MADEEIKTEVKSKKKKSIFNKMSEVFDKPETVAAVEENVAEVEENVAEVESDEKPKYPKPRQLKAEFVQESIQDLKAVHGLDIDINTIRAERQHEWKNKLHVTDTVFNLVSIRGWSTKVMPLSRSEIDSISEIKYRLRQGRKVTVCTDSGKTVAAKIK